MKDTPKNYTYQRFWRNFDARSARIRPTMEKKNPSQQKKALNKVCRKLFHDDDDIARQNYNKRIAEEMRADRERNKQKWNFDFERGVPQTGQYEWVKVDKYGNEIPASIVNNEENKDTQDERTERAESTARHPREDDESTEVAAKRFKR